jgi:biopolymer transport protein ExbB
MLQHTFTRTAAALTTLAFSASALAEDVVENPYGLSALWAQGDGVAKATLLILVIMSMGSWYVIFTKLAEQNRVMRYAQTAQDNFWNAGEVPTA